MATQKQVNRFLAGRTGGTLAGGADSPDHQSETRDDADQEGAVGTADQNGTEREAGEHADHEDARPADAVGAAVDGHIHRRTIIMDDARPPEPDGASEPTIGHELPHPATEAEEKGQTEEDMRMSDEDIDESGKLPPVVLPRSLCLTHSLSRATTDHEGREFTPPDVDTDDDDDEDSDGNGEMVEEPEGQMQEYLRLVYNRLRFEVTGDGSTLPIDERWLLSHLNENDWWIRAVHAPRICEMLEIEYGEPAY